MKIAQITWIAYTNFGTTLQALALQRVLTNLGHNVTLIDDTRYTDINKYLTIPGLLRRVKNPHIWKEIKRYRQFADRYLNIDREWRNTDELSQKYEAFVCGSDQIWSSLLPNHHNGFYFAAPMIGHKVAYAPSLGSKNAPSNYCDMIAPWLKDFNALSSREEVGAKILEGITGREIPTVLDPTLLLSSTAWAQFALTEASEQPPYLLAYFLTFNKTYLKFTRNLANKLGVPLAIFSIDKRMKAYADIWLTVDPKQFLQTIAECQGLITDSFHGTIFALHFHRPLLTVQRFKNTDRNNQNSRIENLFRMVNISDNFISAKELLTKSITLKNYDWHAIEQRIDTARQHSINYLKNALC